MEFTPPPRNPQEEKWRKSPHVRIRRMVTMIIIIVRFNAKCKSPSQRNRRIEIESAISRGREQSLPPWPSRISESPRLRNQQKTRWLSNSPPPAPKNLQVFAADFRFPSQSIGEKSSASPRQFFVANTENKLHKKNSLNFLKKIWDFLKNLKFFKKWNFLKKIKFLKKFEKLYWIFFKN